MGEESNLRKSMFSVLPLCHPWRQAEAWIGSGWSRRRLPAILLLVLHFLLLTALPLLAGTETLVPGTKHFVIDPLRSYLAFSIQFMGLRREDGTFHDYSGTLMLAENDIAQSTITVVIKSASIYTGVEARDRHLRTSDFFGVTKYPIIRFQSSSVDKQGQQLILLGNLFLHGVTRQVRIPFSIDEVRPDERNDDKRVNFRGKLTVNRADYGILGNYWGNKVLSDEVEIDLNIEAIHSPLASISRFRPPNDSPPEQELSELLAEGGIDAVRARFAAFRTESATLEAGAEVLLGLAKKQIAKNEQETARELLLLNLEHYPDHLKSWDLLGRIQLAEGALDAAIRSYENLLTLDAYNTDAIEFLRWLRPKAARGAEVSAKDP